MDASALVFDAHGQCLRLLTSFSGRHASGLAQAARSAPLTARLRRKLIRLDSAFQVVRHITLPSVQSLVNNVVDELAGAAPSLPPASPVQHFFVGSDAASTASDIVDDPDTDIETETAENLYTAENLDTACSDGGIALVKPPATTQTQTEHSDNGIVILQDPADLIATFQAQVFATLRADLVARSAAVAASLAAPLLPACAPAIAPVVPPAVVKTQPITPVNSDIDITDRGVLHHVRASMVRLLVTSNRWRRGILDEFLSLDGTNMLDLSRVPDVRSALEDLLSLRGRAGGGWVFPRAAIVDFYADKILPCTSSWTAHCDEVSDMLTEWGFPDSMASLHITHFAMHRIAEVDIFFG
eukprot:CAMPEP_0117601554 /NCGR_PEP_ID=MMETSP0784-20121206/77096_1 /TAXON_ID=39447 /ORGANISM="" /LENGTH=355 /DNA_ID=CAMNT_0005404287 /DNA_START=77 /DNA_END=1140 /DNA_ORIENTATION=-